MKRKIKCISSGMFLVFMILLAAAPPLFGHGGEDHSATPHPIVVAGNMLTAVAYPDTLEVFVKYSAPVTGEDTKLLFFFSSFRTNVPLDPSEITISVLGARNTVIAQPLKKESGIYGCIVRFFADTSYSIQLTYVYNGEHQQTTLSPILAGKAALAALENNHPSVSSNPMNSLLYVLGGILLLGIIALFYRRYSVRKVITNKKKITTNHD